MLYCSNDACETRINHPINKELEKMRERAEAKRKREAEKMPGWQRGRLAGGQAGRGSHALRDASRKVDAGA